jgi:hypothetical protein
MCRSSYAMNKMVRKQVFITTEQNRRLKAHAAATGVSEAELVRAGIDLRLERRPDRVDWRSLADRLSGAWAERENLQEEMREIRRRWNRREQVIGGRKTRRPVLAASARSVTLRRCGKD